MDWSTFEKQSHSIYEKLYDTHVEFYHLWVEQVLFTWRWWMAVALIVLPWLIWFFVRKKECTDRLLYAGFFVMIFSSALDMVGIALNLWYYPVNVFPIMPEFIPFDICALPVATMLCIQYFPNISPFIKAVIYASTGSFIFQPINKLTGLYRGEHWKDYYSAPIFIFIYLIANYISTKNKFDKIK